MKSAIIAILKFNSVIAILFLGLLLFANQAGIRGPSIKMAGLLVLLLIICILGNLKIAIGKRHEIITSIRKSTIEAAAATIEFKEAANLRAQERIEERKNKSK